MTAAHEIPDAEPESEPPLREDRLSYTPTARSVTLCRRRAARLVAEWGYPDHASDAALLVSELATNALLHGCMRGRLFRVHLALTATALRVEVSDPRGERLPGLCEAGADDSYGRGLLIVARLADRWGVEPRIVGKTVFAELALRPPGMAVGPREHSAGPPHTRTAGATTPR